MSMSDLIYQTPRTAVNKPLRGQEPDYKNSQDKIDLYSKKMFVLLAASFAVGFLTRSLFGCVCKDI